MNKFPTIINFLNELFPLEKDRETIIHYMRQSLVAPDIAQLPLCLIGTRECGKTLFLELFKQILEYNDHSGFGQLRIIDDNSFKSYKYYNYRWAGINVIAIEEDKISQETLDFISEIIGKKKIEVNRPDGFPYELYNITTWILLSNYTKNFDDFEALYTTIRLGKITHKHTFWESMSPCEVPFFVDYLKNLLP